MVIDSGESFVAPSQDGADMQNSLKKSNFLNCKHTT